MRNGVRIVQRIEQFLVPSLHHETGVVLLTAIVIPHPITSRPTPDERFCPDIADELGEAEHAWVPVQDIRHHRGAAPAGAQNEDRWNGYGTEGRLPWDRLVCLQMIRHPIAEVIEYRRLEQKHEVFSSPFVGGVGNHLM